MTMSNVVFKRLYPNTYTSDVSTRVSNALLVGKTQYIIDVDTQSYFFVGAIIGQVFVGLICDRIGRKAALVFTTLLIIIGAIIGTAAHGAHGSVHGLFWCLTFARGITGVVSTVLVRLYMTFTNLSLINVCRALVVNTRHHPRAQVRLQMRK